MVLSRILVSAGICLLSSCSFVSGLAWNATEFMFVFGDSYTTDGYNVSAGVTSPDPGYTSSNGLNWVEFLGTTYNQTDITVFDLASGGATIDAALVPPYLPTVLSVVDQVTQFNEYLASKPYGAEWDSSNSLFAIWIGINDVGNSVGWTNITQFEFYGVLMDRLFTQVEDLYQNGARSFLFVTVPPTDRAPLFLEQGPEAAAQMYSDIANYNTQLTQSVRTFEATHSDLSSVTVFDSQPIFNTLLDEWQTFGFVNVTGYCAAYENGTPTQTTQVEGCAPVSNYFWLNTLHPVFTVHNILAKAISTALAGYTAPVIPT
ncbi:carbohydrate esterase family 16 protein [Serpula lacrymans var. lacrymans S7.3]|uniref:Carbohydrate esterase family 16 protein n=2 Tax=Serpula lacrymans var. lacrymans TaxID=341189 RepID=F8Q7Y5_SERL3|nr:carbohydrate esterase family 16 protein [Serpula lacrymans var. lacrymans S7.9]EGN95673.1 carbohydrate esterase family 16 protein [Serpula lacrymans var. lacrymans S7.3]EGO21200.1 carbohydrate esterase family 16 protein [Serpula lacrymans var. lacrymans S7.9]